MIKVNEKLAKSGGACLGTRIQNVLEAESSCDVLTPAGSARDDSACAAGGDQGQTSVGRCDTAKGLFALLQGLPLEEQNKFFGMIPTSSKAPPEQTLLGQPQSAGAASGEKVGPGDDQGSDENKICKAQAWDNGAWHAEVKKVLQDLQEAKKVDIEKLDKYALDNFKSLPVEVALVVVQKRMNTDTNVRNESGFLQKTCDNLRNQWQLDAFEVEESSDDDVDDDDSD